MPRLYRLTRVVDSLGIAISLGCIVFLVIGGRAVWAQTTPAIEQAVFNANSSSALSTLSVRLQKLEDLHLERVLGQLDALTKIGYLLLVGVIGNLISTVMQIMRGPNSRKR